MTGRHRWASPALWVAVPIVVLIGVAALLTWRQTQQQQEAQQRIDRLEATVTALAGALKKEQAATVNAGGQPATAPAEQIASTASTVGPTGDKGDKGDTGARGPQGAPGVPGPPPSPDQVRNAVGAYLAANPPEGGKPPTSEQIAAAVAMYCSNGNCRGADGATGAAGAAGPAGQSITGPQGATGPAGPGPSDDQVAWAVAAFCGAHSGCVGAMGAQGPAGPAVGSWTFTVGITEYTCSDPDGDGRYTCPGTLPPP